MNRLVRVLLILLFFEMGAVLVLIPWSSAWERNPVLERYPALIPYLLNPSVRGAITGLGLLDIALAAVMIRRRALRQPNLATRN